MTPAEIKERLREAANVIKRLPPPRLVVGYPTRSIPEAVINTWGAEYEAAGAYDEEAGKSETVKIKDTYVRPAAPRGQEIDDAWEAVDWLGYLSYSDHRLVWFWAKGAPWWKIAQRYGRSESAMQRRMRYAIERISKGLKKKVDGRNVRLVRFRPNGGGMRPTAV